MLGLPEGLQPLITALFLCVGGIFLCVSKPMFSGSTRFQERLRISSRTGRLKSLRKKKPLPSWLGSPKGSRGNKHGNAGGTSVDLFCEEGHNFHTKKHIWEIYQVEMIEIQYSSLSRIGSHGPEGRFYQSSEAVKGGKHEKKHVIICNN